MPCKENGSHLDIYLMEDAVVLCSVLLMYMLWLTNQMVLGPSGILWLTLDSSQDASSNNVANAVHATIKPKIIVL